MGTHTALSRGTLNNKCWQTLPEEGVQTLSVQRGPESQF